MVISEKLNNLIESTSDNIFDLIKFSYNEDVLKNYKFWLIFDKNLKPYFIEHKSYGEGKNLLTLYKVDKGINYIAISNIIGDCKFSLMKNLFTGYVNNAWLAELWIKNRDYINLGLGSQLFDIMEYSAYNKGALEIQGFLARLTKEQVTRDLEPFYIHKGFKIDYSEITEPSDMPKLFKTIEMKDINKFKERGYKMTKNDKLIFNILAPSEKTLNNNEFQSKN